MIFFILFLSDVEEIKYIGNREYIPNVIETIKKAKHTIDIVIYSAGYYPTHPKGPDKDLYGAMFDAVKRGVRVRVIIESASWNLSNTRKNEIAANYMKEGGVQIFWDPPDITSHSKIVIVDTLYCVVGSTNWTYYAFTHNNESSVIIKSRELAERMNIFFEDLLKVSTKELKLEIESGEEEL